MRITRKAFFALCALAPFGYVLATRERPQPRRGRPAGGYGPNYFPNVLLSTHENKKVRFYDDLLRDKIVVISFMYVQCAGICLPVLRNLVQVQKMLGDRVGRDIFMYSITLDPENDTPEVLRSHAEILEVGPGWLFLTGEPEDVELLRHKLGFWDRDPVLDADKTQHGGMVLYGNEPMQRWAACPGQGRPEWMTKSILWVAGPKKM